MNDNTESRLPEDLHTLKIRVHYQEPEVYAHFDDLILAIRDNAIEYYRKNQESTSQVLNLFADQLEELKKMIIQKIEDHHHQNDEDDEETL